MTLNSSSKMETEKKYNPYSKCSFYKPYASMTRLNILSTVNEICSTEPRHPSASLLANYTSYETQITYQEQEKNDDDDETQKKNLLTPPRPTPKPKSTEKVPVYLRKRSSLKCTNLDHILNVIGSFGFYQKLQFLLIGFLAVLPAMMAYSYVFVSATPKFTCSVVREIQLTSYADSIAVVSNSDSAKSRPTELNKESSDDPFRYFKKKRTEYFVETRRFIQLFTDEELRNRTVKFDNNCQITAETLIKHHRLTSSSSSLSAVTAPKEKSAKTRQTNLQCVEWVYDESVYGRTTVTDWDLVCLKSHLKAATQNAFILGTGCSAFTGLMSDRFGRRTTLIILITLMVVVLNGTMLLMHSPLLSVGQKFVIFTFSRFLQGVGQTMYSVGFVLLLEITGPGHRLKAGNILAYSFSVGQMCLNGLAYALHDWLKIQWCLAAYVIPFFAYYWLVPESPRWLLSMNQVTRARHVINKITRVNNGYNSFVRCLQVLITQCSSSQSKEIFKNEQGKSEKKHDLAADLYSAAYIHSLLQEEANKLTSSGRASYTATWHGLLSSPRLLRRCLVLFYTWMVILAVYLGVGMGISGNLDKHLDPYLVFGLAAFFEFASIVTCHLVLNRFGRKYPLVVFLLVTAVALYLVPMFWQAQRAYVSVAFYLLAKYGIGGAQLTCMILTGELYPTPMRSTGVGLSVAVARLGGVWAPQINVLSGTLGSIYVPFGIFSALALLACVLCAITLPETLNRPLPANIREAEELGRRTPPQSI